MIGFRKHLEHFCLVLQVFHHLQWKLNDRSENDGFLLCPWPLGLRSWALWNRFLVFLFFFLLHLKNCDFGHLSVTIKCRVLWPQFMAVISGSKGHWIMRFLAKSSVHALDTTMLSGDEFALVLKCNWFDLWLFLLCYCQPNLCIYFGPQMVRM